MNKIIGNKLKSLREAKNMSQEEVAEFLSVSQSAYARMERGQSASWANHFNRICEVFEIRPEDLVRKDSEFSKNEYLENEEGSNKEGLLSAYRKTIRQYELQIEDLKIIVRNLNKR